MGKADLHASVSTDGSVRVFDLRDKGYDYQLSLLVLSLRTMTCEVKAVIFANMELCLSLQCLIPDQWVQIFGGGRIFGVWQSICYSISLRNLHTSPLWSRGIFQANPRVVVAYRAMTVLGIKEVKVKPVLKQLLKLYDKNWELIEQENYRVLADAIFEQDGKEDGTSKSAETESTDEINYELRSSSGLVLHRKDENGEQSENNSYLKLNSW